MKYTGIRIFIMIVVLGSIVFGASKAQREYGVSTSENRKVIVQIIYKNWQALDILLLQSRYKLIPLYGIADGVLLFSYTGNKNIAQVIRQIKEEQKGIADIRVYKKYRFRTF